MVCIVCELYKLFGLCKFKFKYSWDVNISLGQLCAWTFVYVRYMHMLLLIGALRQKYFPLATDLIHTHLNHHGLCQRNRDLVDMCNIRLQKKYRRLIRLHFGMLLIQSHLLNDPLAKLLFFLFFELFLKCELLVFDLRFAWDVLVFLCNTMVCVLGLWEGYDGDYSG